MQYFRNPGWREASALAYKAEEHNVELTVRSLEAHGIFTKVAAEGIFLSPSNINNIHSFLKDYHTWHPSLQYTIRGIFDGSFIEEVIKNDSGANGYRKKFRAEAESIIDFVFKEGENESN